MAKSKAKAWYKSKTIQVNLLFLVFVIVQIYTENYLLDPQFQATVLTLLNLFLRIVTTSGIATPKWFQK